MCSVKPAIVPCIDGSGEDECCSRKAVCGNAENEDGGDDVHDNFSFFGVTPVQPHENRSESVT